MLKKNNLLLKNTKKSASSLALTSLKKRNNVLKDLIQFIKKNEVALLNANQKDLNLLAKDSTPSFKERLTLSHARILQICVSLEKIIIEPDPLKSLEPKTVKKLKNGLILKKMKSPLGVIFIIFESRPNVAIEAFAMAFKAGNSLILKAGKETFYTVRLIYKLIHKALKKNNLPTSILWGLESTDRNLTQNLLNEKKFIDVVIPRGGEKLIEFITEHSKIPVIKNDRGLCHIYIDEFADLKMASNILLNAKTQRPSVCNSMETMLIHKKVANRLLPQVYEMMQDFQVSWFGCKKTKKILSPIKLAIEKNWNTEYLDQTLNCKIVDSLSEAIQHIKTYSSGHSEAIVTKNKNKAIKFQTELDSAVIYWNASTRFTDGFEFGMGGEIGISTQKLHVRGPVGLDALTTDRWIVHGKGQIRT